LQDYRLLDVPFPSPRGRTTKNAAFAALERGFYRLNGGKMSNPRHKRLDALLRIRMIRRNVKSFL
jgi:hypothetical protein